MFHCRKSERHIVVCMHLSDWPSCYSKPRCNFTADMLNGVISVLYCESKPAGNDSRNRDVVHVSRWSHSPLRSVQQSVGHLLSGRWCGYGHHSLLAQSQSHLPTLLESEQKGKRPFLSAHHTFVVFS